MIVQFIVIVWHCCQLYRIEWHFILCVLDALSFLLYAIASQCLARLHILRLSNEPNVRVRVGCVCVTLCLIWITVRTPTNTRTNPKWIYRYSPKVLDSVDGIISHASYQLLEHWITWPRTNRTRETNETRARPFFLVSFCPGSNCNFIKGNETKTGMNIDRTNTRKQTKKEASSLSTRWTRFRAANNYDDRCGAAKRRQWWTSVH